MFNTRKEREFRDIVSSFLLTRPGELSDLFTDPCVSLMFGGDQSLHNYSALPNSSLTEEDSKLDNTDANTEVSSCCCPITSNEAQCDVVQKSSSEKSLTNHPN